MSKGEDANSALTTEGINALFLSPRSRRIALFVPRQLLAVWLSALLLSPFLFLSSVYADNTAQGLPFTQNWTDTGLITANDNWTGVPGIIGYRGDDLTAMAGADPQTIVADGTSTLVNVLANQTNPSTFGTGGVAEFHLANPTIALNGSGTADAPFLLLHLNTIGQTTINIAYNLRDLDGSIDNAVMPVALQYRVGNSGNFTNIAAGFVADATTGPNVATLVTPVNATLPAAADNQTLLQVRIITANASGNDEWVGIDDLQVTGNSTPTTPPTGTGTANPSTVPAGNQTLLTVAVTPGAEPPSSGINVIADLSAIGDSSAQAFTDNGNNTFTYNATVAASTTAGAKTLPISISDAEGRSSTTSISLTVEQNNPAGAAVVISQVYGGGGNPGATYRNDYVELYNRGGAVADLSNWSLQYASATGSNWVSNRQPLGGTIAPGEYYLVSLASGGANGAQLPASNITGEINLSSTTGKVALVNNSDALAGNCPLSDTELIDFVGYGGSADCQEGSTRAAAPSNTSAIFRQGNGSIDTNNNGPDFTVAAPLPRRTAPIVELGPAIVNTEPRTNGTDAPRDASITITFTEPVNVTGNWFSINCATTGLHNDATVVGSSRIYTITPNTSFINGEQCTFTIESSLVTDQDTDDSQPNTDTLAADYTSGFMTSTGAPPPYSPDVHLTMGNPTDATADINTPDDYLMVKPEFTLSYNRDRGTSNWTSWHLDDMWIGDLPRVDTFRPDPAVPGEWYRVQATDYSGSGFDRGHLTPNADRDESRPVNQATFLMTNMLPQAPDQNQGPWADMENDLRALVSTTQEAYIVMGGAGIGGTGNNGFATTIANNRVTVPNVTWKVILVLPRGDDDVARVTASTQTIAVIMPNSNTFNGSTIRDDNWQDFQVSIDEVETLTGYDFFSNVPDEIENTIEASGGGGTPPLQYYPLAQPIRLLDTRAGQTACDTPGAPLAGDSIRTQPARLLCGGANTIIPASAQAIVGNATVVNADSEGDSGFITLYPSGAARPTVSNLNYVPEQIVPNSFTVGLNAADGSFNIYASSSTHFIVDITGYYAPPATGGLYYHPLTNPIRLLDTRNGQPACDAPGAPLAGGASRTQSARVVCGGVTIPVEAQAIVGNATVVNDTGAAGGFVTLYPSGAAQPTASNLNYSPEQVVPNSFTVGLGAGDGAFQIYPTSGINFIVDVTGYYSDQAVDVNGTGLLYHPLPGPVRLLDTRAGQPACDTPGAPLTGGGARTQLARTACSGIPDAAQVIVGNATVVNNTAENGSGFVTLFPSGTALPTVSNLNYVPGQVVPNAFTVRLGGDGAFQIYASTSINFIADLTGYFAP